MVAKLLSEDNALSNFQLFEVIAELLVTAVRTQVRTCGFSRQFDKTGQGTCFSSGLVLFSVSMV